MTPHFHYQVYFKGLHFVITVVLSSLRLSHALHAVLFRAKLTGSGTCEEILTAITNWVSSGRAAITVNFNTLRASQDCIVEIDSVDSQFPQCDAQ